LKLRSSLLLRVFLTVCSMLALGGGEVFAQASERIVYSFHPLALGHTPNGPLISDAAGNLYGTTIWGGDYGLGTVFELTPNSHGGWTEIVLYSFTGGSDVYAPSAALILDKAGNLYGAATEGGGMGLGGVFRLAQNSHGVWVESVLCSLDGYQPDGGLVFDDAGDLYGVVGIGPKAAGSVFRLSPGSNGHWTKQVLYTFTGGTDGGAPNAGLVFDPAGHLYGTTSEGGAAEAGVVFELTRSSGGSWTEVVLYSFSGGSDGYAPSGGVIFDGAGSLYGTTISGGVGCDGASCGTVFKLTRASVGQWTESVLYNFSGGSDGQNPHGMLAFDAVGNLYGTTASGGSGNWGTVFELSPGSDGQWSESVLWRFTGGGDGEYPESGVLIGGSGQLYGTATSGGGSTENGTVFELTPSTGGHWTETTLTNFPYTGGGSPVGNLISDSSGNFYGTADYGGTHGYGTVYELSPSAEGTWKETTLYNFTTGLGGGASPSSLIFDASGNLYGETARGGAQGRGLVFELSPSSGGNWTEKDLYSFKGDKDGGNPFGGLIFDGAGTLYGTTEFGGSTGCGSACGTVFEVMPSANGPWVETVLYQFTGGSDGGSPAAGLVFDEAGNLYGTTEYGGEPDFECASGCGTVFKLSPGSAGGWTETVLHQFTGYTGDGAFPAAGLILDSSGNLYGTTTYGGTHTLDCSIGCGAVFELSPASGGWTESTLSKFTGGNGFYPLAGVILDSGGNLYGTSEGGLYDTEGTVFELSPISGGWSQAILHVFPFPIPGDLDGLFPEGGVILDHAGNLYGTTIGGGVAGGGTVFEVTP